MRRPWRVVLCGSNYAARYAVSLQPKFGFEIVALLARGSARSKALAKELGVPLLRTVSEAGTVDAACVAVGAKAGTDLSREFLRRGIHVLQEHPVSSRDAAGTLKVAESSGAIWHINGHFGDLTAPQAFAAACRRAAKKSPALTAIVLADVRLAYGAIDTLSRALGFTSFRLRLRESNSKNAVFYGRIGSSDSVVVLHASEGPDGADYHFGFDLKAVFTHETIHLASLAGPVIRTAALRGGRLRGGTWSLESPPETNVEDFVVNRAEANLDAMVRLRTHAEKGRVPPDQEPAQRQAVIALRELVLSLGFPDSAGDE